MEHRRRRAVSLSHAAAPSLGPGRQPSHTGPTCPRPDGSPLKQQVLGAAPALVRGWRVSGRGDCGVMVIFCFVFCFSFLFPDSTAVHLLLSRVYVMTRVSATNEFCHARRQSTGRFLSTSKVVYHSYKERLQCRYSYD